MERDVALTIALPANVAVGSKVNAMEPPVGASDEFKVIVGMEVVFRVAELKSRPFVGSIVRAFPLVVPKVSAVRFAGVDKPTILPRMVCVKVFAPL